MASTRDQQVAVCDLLLFVQSHAGPKWISQMNAWRRNITKQNKKIKKQFLPTFFWPIEKITVCTGRKHACPNKRIILNSKVSSCQHNIVGNHEYQQRPPPCQCSTHGHKSGRASQAIDLHSTQSPQKVDTHHASKRKENQTCKCDLLSKRKH